MKQVTAVGDDEICRSKEPVNTIAINGKVVAEVFDKDEGRQLPTWNGWYATDRRRVSCYSRILIRSTSKYFGLVLRCDVLGVARPLWTWNPD